MTDPSRAQSVAVVTGASGRLGRHVTEEFALRGFRVAAVVRRRPPDPGPEAVTHYECDVLDEESVVETFRRIRGSGFRIASVVHTVGTWAMSPILATSLTEWNRLVDANLTSAFLCLREGARILDRPGGLVAVASAQGADRGAAAQAAYSASKAGVIRLVESIAAELGPEGVSARVIAPSTLLFDGESGPGVPAVEVARLCADLADPGCPLANGALVRAYGDVAP